MQGLHLRFCYGFWRSIKHDLCHVLNIFLDAQRASFLKFIIFIEFPSIPDDVCLASSPEHCVFLFILLKEVQPLLQISHKYMFFPSGHHDGSSMYLGSAFLIFLTGDFYLDPRCCERRQTMFIISLFVTDERNKSFIMRNTFLATNLSTVFL